MQQESLQVSKFYTSIASNRKKYAKMCNSYSHHSENVITTSLMLTQISKKDTHGHMSKYGNLTRLRKTLSPVYFMKTFPIFIF